jgi:hypothetical protein
MFATLFAWLKKGLIYGGGLLIFFAVVFFTGEQFEVSRLSNVAACEGSANPSVCIRTKGYLAEQPFYPDLGRRYVAGFARWVGGDLGATYAQSPESLAPTQPATIGSSQSAAAPAVSSSGLPIPAPRR